MFHKKQNTVLPAQHGNGEEAGGEAPGTLYNGGSLSLEEVESQAPNSEREGTMVHVVPRPLSCSGTACSTEGWQLGNLPVTVISHIFAFLQDGATLSCGTMNLQWFAALNYSEKDLLVPVAREWAAADKKWLGRNRWLRGAIWVWIFVVIVLFYLWMLFFTTIMAAFGIEMGKQWNSPALTRFGWDGLILTIAEYSLAVPWCFFCCCSCGPKTRDQLYKGTITLFSIWYLSVFIVLMVRLGGVREENPERWNIIWPTFALWGPLTIVGSMTFGPVIAILERDSDPGTLLACLAKKNATTYRNGNQQAIEAPPEDSTSVCE